MRQLDQLLASLAAPFRTADAEQYGADRYGAPSFSVLDVMGTNETALSRIVAHLLDPTGTHGQGPLFLHAFLRAVGVPVPSGMERIQVRREAPTASGRRIDVVLESASLVIGIENKPYAGEGHDQLRDYLTHLRMIARGRTLRLIFMSDREASIQEPDLVRIAYAKQSAIPSLSMMLKASLPEIKAPRVRAFIEDLAKWIDWRLGEQGIMASDLPFHVGAVMRRAEESAANRKAIGAVLLAQGQVHNTVLDQIATAIFRAVQKSSPDAELTDVRPMSQVLAKALAEWGIRRPSWPANCMLAIEAESHGPRGVGYGVVALDPSSKEAAKDPTRVSSRIAEVTQLVQVVSGSEKPSGWWRWARYARSPDWSAQYCARLLVESDGNVEEHPDVIELVTEMTALADALNKLAPS